MVQGGDTLASSCNELVCVWDTHTATLLNVFPAELNRIQTLKFDVDDGELLVGGVIDAEMLVRNPPSLEAFVDMCCSRVTAGSRARASLQLAVFRCVHPRI